MLEECHVRVTCISIVKNAILIIKAVFILVAESIIVPPVRPFMYVYSLKVCSRRLQPHAYNAGVFAEDACSHLTLQKNILP